MSKISPDGFVKSDIYSDFSIFNFNNIYIGQYAAKINIGSNNLIIGNNAGKIGIGLNNAIFIGANAGSELLDKDKVISIGDIQVSNNNIENKSINIGYNIRNNSNGIVITNDKQLPQLFLNSNGLLDIGLFNQGNTETSIGSYNSNLKANINIGNSNISTIDNSIVIGNSIYNDKYSLNIDNVLCKDDNGIYIGCGIYKNIPIIIGSLTNDFTFLNNLAIENNLITSVFKIKNNNNTSISFITNANQNIIYNLPIAPKYDYSFLSTDANGNLEWVELDKIVITDIISTADIICNTLECVNIIGDGSFMKNVNITNNTTDELKEGINNLYWNINFITKIFYSYPFTTDDIKYENNSNYFSFNKYSSNFYSNLSNNLITTDDIRGGRFYSSNDYYSNSLYYLLNVNTDFINEGTSNLYYNPSKLNTDLIKEGFSNFYFNESFNINISNTNLIKEGSSNFYYNSSYIDSNFKFINTDLFRQGNSNFYATDYNIYKYLNENLPTTDSITQGITNDYFCNISNQKYFFNADKIREGNNLYYQSSNQITGIISFNTTTDIYKEGTSNIYYYENRAINDFLKVINSNITTDSFSNEKTKKFINNNFYNNNLQIKGFLKANNINDLDKERLRSNIEPKIGPLTEIYQVYDFERLSVVGKLSNIEIGYTSDNSSVIKVPFIVIDNKVGINNSNPRYDLDVDGTVNCSNLIINNSNFSDIKFAIITDSSNQLYNRFTSELITLTNYYTKSQTSNIFTTSNVLSNTSNQLFRNIINQSDYTQIQLSNIFITSNILSNTSNQLFKNSINFNSFENYNIYFSNSKIGINNKNPLYNIDINSEINIYSNIRNDNNIIISNSRFNVVVQPLVWFKFNEGSLLIDSMGGNPLTYQYPTTFLDQVVFDNSIYIIGNGSVKFNKGTQTLIRSDSADIINTINNYSGITISFWIYGYNLNSLGYYLRFLLNTSSGTYNIIISGINNLFNIQFQTPQGTYIKSNVSVGALNKWNSFVLIIEKTGTWKIYSNGTINTTFISDFLFPSVFVTYSGNTMIIGNSAMNIDDFRIFPCILTETQITDLNNKIVDITTVNYKISSDIFVTSNALFDNLNKTWVINDGSNIYNNNSGNIGIGTSKPTYKLHVVGNAGVSGTVTQGFSDIRLKNKIEIIDKPFSIINNLEGFYYTPNDLAVTFGFNGNRDVGLNALEAKKIIPEIVSLAPFDCDENKQSKSGENYLTISYEKLVPVLLEGLKELKREVDYLKNELKYR